MYFTFTSCIHFVSLSHLLMINTPSTMALPLPHLPLQSSKTATLISGSEPSQILKASTTISSTQSQHTINLKTPPSHPPKPFPQRQQTTLQPSEMRLPSLELFLLPLLVSQAFSTPAPALTPDLQLPPDENDRLGKGDSIVVRTVLNVYYFFYPEVEFTGRDYS